MIQLPQVLIEMADQVELIAAGRSLGVDYINLTDAVDAPFARHRMMLACAVVAHEGGADGRCIFVGDRSREAELSGLPDCEHNTKAALIGPGIGINRLAETADSCGSPPGRRGRRRRIRG
jgi:hypothetical protein